MTHRKVILFLLLILGVGLITRLLSYVNVYSDGNIILMGFDSYYHMRRVFQILADYPNVPYFDSEMSYPDGAAIIWPPLFDFFIATMAKLFSLGAKDVLQVEGMAIWICPILGVATALPVYWFTNYIFNSRPMALLAATFLMMVPMHINYSMFGFVDHHTAVTLTQVMMGLLLFKCYEVSRVAPGSTLSFVTAHYALLALASFSIAAGFLIWNGYIFFLAVVDIFLLIVLVKEGFDKDSKIAAVCWITHTLAALTVLLVILKTIANTGRPVTALTLSHFHLFAIVAFAALGAAVHTTKLRQFQKLSQRPVNLILTAVICMVVFAIAGMAGVLEEGMEWVLTKDKFMASVDESRPLILKNDELNLVYPARAMGGLFLLTPFALLALAWEIKRDGKFEPGKLFLLIWTLFLLLIAVTQKRFGDQLAPVQSMVVAYFLIRLYGWTLDFLQSRKLFGSKAKVVCVAYIAAIALIANIGFFEEAVWAKVKYITSPDKDKSLNEKLYHSLSRLRSIANNDEYVINAINRPAIINPWAYGHPIHYVTKFPTVTNNFGQHIGKQSYKDSIDFFMEYSEEKAIEIMKRRKVRFVVTDYSLGLVESAALIYEVKYSKYFKLHKMKGYTLATTIHPALLKTMFFRMTRFFGSEQSFKNAKGDSLNIKPLNHFRLYIDDVTDDKNGYLKVFEYVKGAKLMITGVPNEKARITYKYTSNSGREREYSKNIKLDGSGNAVAILPYSSQRVDLGHTSSYILSYNGTIKEFTVNEEDVQNGGEIKMSFIDKENKSR